MVKNIIIVYQVLLTIMATVLLINYSIDNSIEMVSVLGLVFNVIIFIASYRYFRLNRKNLFIVIQMLQVFGFGVYGVYFYLHQALFVGPVFIVEGGKLGLEISGAFPEYAFKYIEGMDDVIFSINIIPILIIYLIEKNTISNKSSQN